MVCTVTFNPAIDYVVRTGSFRLGETNRSVSEEMYFGGKGINVSAVLKELDISQPTLSYHMKILCQSGIVKERPVGPWKYYSIDAEGCEYARKLLQALRDGGDSMGLRLFRLIGELDRGASTEPERTESMEAACAWHTAAGCCRSNG